MIRDVDETLGALLSGELRTIPGCPITDRSQVTFVPPASADETPSPLPFLNIYLHDIRENRSVRESGLRLVRRSGDSLVGVQRSPINLDLSYLVTAHAGTDAALEHRLLSDALSVLLRFESIPKEYLSGAIPEEGIRLAVAQPEHLANTDPPALWQALGGRMRTALSLVVTAQHNPYETKWTKVVRELVVGVGLGTPPYGPQHPLDLSSIRVSAAGVVLDQAHESPLSGVRVTADGWDQEAVTDGRGFFYLLGLAPGAHTLRFQRAGYQSHTLDFTAPAIGHPEQLEPCVVALHGLSDQERALEAAAHSLSALTLAGGTERSSEPETVHHASLSGMLRHADGRPAAYVMVRAGGKEAMTDADGLYCFFDLPPGSHTLVTDLPDPSPQKSEEKKRAK